MKPNFFALLSPLALCALAPVPLADLQFLPPEVVALVPSISREIHLADLDADGDFDLVAIDPEASQGIKVFANDGTGTFAFQAGYALPDWGQTAAIADLDGDADLDVVAVANHFSTDIVTYWNDGTGGLVAGPTSALAWGSEPRDLKLGDMDGDGDLDAVISNWGDDTVAVHPGDGAGGFGAGVAYPVLGLAFGIALADLDGDLSLDLVVSNYGGEPTYTVPGEVWVFLNDGTGALLAPGTYIAGRGTWSVSAVDMDRDGDLDLTAVNRNTFDVSYFENHGDGTFAPGVETPVGGYPVDGVPFDFDGDGGSELAVPSSFVSFPPVKVHVLEDSGSGLAPGIAIAGLGSMYGATAGDVDGDGDGDLLATVYGEIHLFRNVGTQLDSLLVGVNHLVAGLPAQVSLANATPFSLALVGISFAGVMPPAYLPVLDTTFSLQTPLLLASGIPGGDGTLGWTFPLAPSTQGIAFWLQALQYQRSSSTIATQVN